MGRGGWVWGLVAMSGAAAGWAGGAASRQAGRQQQPSAMKSVVILNERNIVL